MTEKQFRTADQLNITEEQRCALVKTLQLLEAGKITHLPSVTLTGDFPPRYSESEPKYFNMSWWRIAADCGTVCCIGGTAEAIGKVRFDNNPEGLEHLFFPRGLDDCWGNITTSHAAKALRNYLFTGSPKWREVMKEKQP